MSWSMSTPRWAESIPISSAAELIAGDQGDLGHTDLHDDDLQFHTSSTASSSL